MTAGIVTFIASVAVLTGLIMWAASLFKFSERPNVAKVILSCIAADGGTILGIVIVGNFFANHLLTGSALVQSLIGVSIFFIIPAAVLMICLHVICDLTLPRSGALALWGIGGCLLIVFLIALLEMKELNAMTGGYLKSGEDYMWVFVMLSGVMMWSGFMLGLKHAGGSSGSFPPIDLVNVVPVQPIPMAPPPPPARPQSAAPTFVPSEPVVAWLVAPTQQGARQFQVVAGDNPIGRSRECRIKIDWDDEVSRQHSLIQYVNRVFELRDLGSANGTFLNGEMVRAPRTLQDGDRIRVGKTEMTFKKV